MNKDEWSANDRKLIARTKEVFRRDHMSSTINLSKCVNDFVYAGSMWSSIFNEETPADIDIFILKSSEDAWNIWVQFFSINNWTETDTNAADKNVNDYKKSSSHILSVKKFLKSNQVPKNIILTDYNTPEDLIEDFDFDHTMIFYHDTSLKLSREAFVAARDKILSTKISNPTSLSEKRIKKFLDRGFKKGTNEPLLKGVK